MCAFKRELFPAEVFDFQTQLSACCVGCIDACVEAVQAVFLELQCLVHLCAWTVLLSSCENSTHAYVLVVLGSSVNTTHVLLLLQDGVAQLAGLCLEGGLVGKGRSYL